MVHGVLKVMERGEHLGVYHIGTGIETTIEDLAREIGRCFDREIKIVTGPLQPG